MGKTAPNTAYLATQKRLKCFLKECPFCSDHIFASVRWLSKVFQDEKEPANIQVLINKFGENIRYAETLCEIVSLSFTIFQHSPIMESLESLHNPEALGQLFSRIEILKKRFPQIGIACQKMPIDQKIKTFNAAEPSAMQFKPKNIDDARKLAAELKETKGISSVHLPNLKFDDAGNVNQKDEIIEMLIQNKPNLITTHLGWKNADLVLDEQGNWRDTDLANEVASELADLFISGINSGKTMTIENVRYKPHKHNFRELLGSKPEHLVATRNKIVQVICAKTEMSPDEVLPKIGYTFDVGHAVGNAHLSEQYPIEAWLKQLGSDIKIMHIHDMRPMIEGDVEIEKTHLPLGEGIIEWKSFFQLQKEYCPSAPMILELTEADTIKSIDYLSKLEQ